MAKVKLTILLIKEGIDDFQTIIKSESDYHIHHQVIDDDKVFYYKKSAPHAPVWLNRFFDGVLDGDTELNVSSVQAVLLVRRRYEGETRVFALTFGFGRNLLRSISIVDLRFGMITALNCISENELKSIDRTSLEAIPRLNRIQTSRLSDVDSFNIDEDRDILRSITGKVKPRFSEKLGKTISGSESLKVSVDVTVENIDSILDYCYDRFHDTTYAEHFGYINNLLPLKDKDLKAELDNRLVEKINQRELENTWMAIPFIVDWTDPVYLDLDDRGGENTSDDLDISEVLSSVFDNRDDIGISELRARKVNLRNGDGVSIGKWSYYQCLYTEIPSDQNSLYILNEGEWYEVKDDYVREVTDYYNNANIFPRNLISCNPGETEGDYNLRLASSNPAFCLMDKKLVATGVSRNSIEFCDVYTLDKELLHVKKGHGSSVLSHLFNQGYVAAELLLQRPFREGLYNVMHNAGYEDWIIQPQNSVNPGDFSIVYCIITDDDEGRPAIPFFSKVAFRNITKTLNNMGFKVYLKNIVEGQVTSH